MTRGSDAILNMPSPTSLRSRRLVLLALGVVDHRAELVDPERARRRGRRGPGGRRSGPSSRAGSPTAIAAITGATASRPIVVATTSNARLSSARGAREAERAHAEHRQAVDVVELDRRADDLEHPRQHAHPHAGRLGHRGSARRSRGVGRRRRDDDAVRPAARRRSGASLPGGPAVDVVGRAAGRSRRRSRGAWLVRELLADAVGPHGSPITRQRSPACSRPATQRATMRPPTMAAKLHEPERGDLAPLRVRRESGRPKDRHGEREQARELEQQRAPRRASSGRAGAGRGRRGRRS